MTTGVATSSTGMLAVVATATVAAVMIRRIMDAAMTATTAVPTSTAITSPCGNRCGGGCGRRDHTTGCCVITTVGCIRCCCCWGRTCSGGTRSSNSNIGIGIRIRSSSLGR